ncbi:methyl-accepting chemotaxis protein [Streptomyces sp. NPDC001553]|uniref:methyl-accepting chemotaxis protein n=1 Tax=Streptomyces sp. NPDC001553 TaxID=3154385 RepID=UPI0033236B95
MPVGALATASVVATQLNDLADKPGLGSRRDELKSLADALQGLGDGDIEPWTELDLLQAYARPESVSAALAEGPEHRAWALLEVAIGTLVFLPLLLTWFGLSRATDAYRTLIGEDPKSAARPFLQLWQSGFEGRLADWSTFGHVAGSATAVILLLCLLAAVHGVRRTRTEHRADQARRTADELLALLVPLLTRAQLLLNEQRLSSPRRFTAELTAAAANLGRLGDNAVRAHERLGEVATSLAASVEAAGTRLDALDAAVLPLERAVSRVEAAVQTNTGEVGRAVAALTDPLEQHTSRLETVVSGNGIMVRKALEDVREVNGEVRDALGAAGERVEDSVTTLAAAQRSFTTGTELAADVTARVLYRLGDVTQDTAEAVALSQRAVLGLEEQTGALRRAAERFAELARAMAGAADVSAAAAEARTLVDTRFVHEARPGPVPAPASAPAPVRARAVGVDLAKGHDAHAHPQDDPTWTARR